MTHVESANDVVHLHTLNNKRVLPYKIKFGKQSIFDSRA